MTMKAKYVPPKIIRKIFPKTIWESGVDKILFTFDDGPNLETTQIILDKLDEHSIKSIFFCVGENVERYPNLAMQIIEEGHLIGNHTHTHKNINFFSKNANDNIVLCSQAIEQVSDSKPKYFRPPHGRVGLITEKLMKQNELKNVMWTLLTYDYKNDINIVKFAVDKYLKENSIIVLHDSKRSKHIIAESIDFIVDRIKSKGYKIGEPSECLK
ncbi:MAG: polysaccharide deacetylase family protein [Melioribacteraceae bacterium]|nr:polysaccharide deacetylase family protein [Melioribacteraceae bacterium]